MRIKTILATTFALALFTCSAVAQSTSKYSNPQNWKWEQGTIVTQTPERAAGQKSVLNLATPRMQTVRVAFVGLGMRGPWAVKRFTYIPGVQIVALCDYEAERAENAQKFLRERNLPPADVYSGEKGYEELCKRPDIDLVYIATDWDHHFPVAKCAMENGKHAAVEVPSAMNLDECWQLVDLSEKTQKHCMILENCCYDYYELNALNMAQNGVFGEVLRAEGAYIHNLDQFWGEYWHNPADSLSKKVGWRMAYNSKNRGDIYATHGLGPVAQCLDIHRGDRFTVLTAMDTKSVHGKEYMEKHTGEACEDFRNGDHTTTLMRTANGKVVEIQHNVMNPQPYNRLFKLTGTKGYATKYPQPKFALDSKQLAESGVKPDMDNINSHGFLPDAEAQKLQAKYEHPIIKKYGEAGREMGHGGMDYMMDARLVYCLQNGLPLDMDVYDLAEWSCLAELGTLSMDHNCAAVAFPDFTRGQWKELKGYKHAYNTTDEASVETIAKAATKAMNEQTKKLKLWALYDKVTKANSTSDKAKAQSSLDAAKAKALKEVQKAIKQASAKK